MISIMNRLHPFTVFIYYALVIGITAFMMHPVILGISFIGVMAFKIIEREEFKIKSVAVCIMAFLVLSLLNPLFYHNGKTVLLVINQNPITLEAIIYGMVAAGVIITVLLWCQKMAQYMTTDKTMYLIGKLSKKGALIIAMVFRLMPQYRTQAKEIRETQKALGLFKKESYIEKLISHFHVFSAMVTWALEHSVDTADSMRARGYGIRKRSSYTNYRFQIWDAVYIVVMLTILGIVLAQSMRNQLSVTYYPEFSLKYVIAENWGTYLTYGFLVFMMPMVESKEIIKWNYLMWKK